ncbi:flagella basal body P-ring formation protein FlgA [Duganella sacchari]|uniref:Flagella basal body P-ring formation protein FlgA n=1 Tax=Duganella sacchari TaxID=551987 RepID=A0A1M7PLJ4_9BURK|nr:flagellar basal body P-ring formation chaperone FlgA [Duganella sacchari]SHN18142.1 flagella basal body P-ring formation protein FlgA [Duganella sacchari]
MPMFFRCLPLRCAGAALLLGAAIAAVPAQALTVELRSAATVSQAQLQLGDIATLSGAEPALLARLARLPLGAAPAAGATLALPRHTIEHWIRAYAGWPAGQIDWRGSAVAHISGAADASAAARLQPLARAALLSWLGQWSSHPSVTLASDEELPGLPSGVLELRPRAFTPAQRPARQMWVWVELWQQGRMLRAVPLRYRVTAPAPALLARHALAAGNRVRADDVEAGETDLAGLARPWPQRDTAQLWAALAQGVRLRRAVAPGVALDAANSEAVPPVCSGDQVQLSLVAGQVALSRTARALQDGVLGQKVAVQAPGSPHSIMVRVTGAGTVEVE